MPFQAQNVPSPCFVMEENLLLRNLERLQYVRQSANCDLILALKGFALYHTFPLVKQYLSGATASSLNEARLIFEEMHCRAHTYAPAYLAHEFDQIMFYSSHITFNSLSQWERYAPRIRQYHRPISCGLRINPQYSEVQTDMYNPCIAGSRLGITRDQLGDTLPEGIEGLHFHTLCENDSHTLARTLEVVEQRFGDLLHQAKWLNMGGGHLITRQGYDADHLIALIQHLQSTYDLQIILEPGSAIAWQTGYLVAEVLDIIDSQGVQVAVLDVSFAAHMPDCLEMPYKPRIWGATDPQADRYTYRMGGMTCLAGDYIGDYAFEQPLQIGDRLVFDDMIHYTMVKTTTFNGVGLPAIGIWKKDDSFQLLRQFGFQSYKDRLG
jgi:carboxynorspermidine decarboxylase